MAEALALEAVTTITTILEKLGISAANEELKLLQDVRGDIQSLSKTLEMIHAVLEDAENMQLTNELVCVWCRSLKRIAYYAEDVLEEFMMEASREPIPVSFLQEIARRIKDIRGELDQINEERKKFKLKASSETSFPPFSRTSFPEKREETSYIQTERTIGRKKEMDDIINNLLGCSDKPESSISSRGSEKVSLVSIVGMGGLGKTTLAQAVFNDERVAKEDQFPFRKWVFVGENFDAKRLIKAIIDEKEDNLQLANLHSKFVSKLKDHKFLIVLDDVWCVNIWEWKQLLAPLILEGNVGKVIVTTRAKKVVDVANVVGIHCSDPLILEPLPYEDSLSIFEKQAFRDGNPDRHPYLREIGYQIVEKLKGVPLAINVVGGSLQNTSDENKWRNVLNHEEWKLPDNPNNIMFALKWSYYHLPPHLRQCFAYCAVFPKDHEFDKEDLFHMWMALNFIQPEGNKRMEDIGSSYFDDLLDRSFFQCIDDCYVMHDLMHDLAESISLNECLRIEGGRSSKNSENVLHFSFSHQGSEPTGSQNLLKYKKSRTLIHLFDYTSVSFTVPPELFLNLKCIRVLELSHCGIKEMPDSISDLKHLRYLNLCFNAEISRLPESLCGLCHLQTLKLKYCNSLHELPKGMSKLTNLRCLEGDEDAISKIDELGRLTSLQKIEEYNVYRKTSNTSNIVELENLNQLRGSLKIRNLENVVSGEEAGLAKLHEKKYIDDLELSWSCQEDDGPESDVEVLEASSQEEDGPESDVEVLEASCQEEDGHEIDAEVLEALQPPATLKTLAIDGNRVVKYPTWMGSQLRYLGTLVLKRCLKLRELPELVSLRSLEIKKCEELRSLSEYGFVNLPSLSKLKIKCCDKLTTLRLQRVPALKTLSIHSCAMLSSVWAEEGTVDLTSLTSLDIYECPELSSYCPEDGLPVSLQKLTIIRCSALQSLPAGLQSLSSLKEMWIEDCPEMKCFPEKNLPTSLQHLIIRYCPKLEIAVRSLKNGAD